MFIHYDIQPVGAFGSVPLNRYVTCNLPDGKYEETHTTNINKALIFLF